VTKRLKPPSGHPPPTTAQTPDGSTIDLVALAEEICRRYRQEFGDEQERYEPVTATQEWCIHHNQHLLSWAVLSLSELCDFSSQVAWLARVLEAREFPLDRLARNLEIAAEVVMAKAVADGKALGPVLRDGAGFVRAGMAP